MSRLDIVTIQS